MKLRIGLVGAGYIATDSHLPVLKNLNNVDVVAICDQNVSVAKEVASRFEIKNVFADFESMVKKEKLDLVDICTPPNTHALLSIQAMKAGCHVLVEKPMATSVQEAEKMIDSSRVCGAKLCVVHQNLCNPAVVKVKRLVEDGVVGDLLNVDVQTFERKDSDLCLNENHWCHALPGGIFYEILPHPIYLLQSFLKGATPVHVLSRKLGNIKWIAKDDLRVLLKAKNGFGSIIASCNSLIHGDTLDIVGTRMALRADLWGRTVILYRTHTKSALSVGMSNLHLSLQLAKAMGSTASTLIKAMRGKASAHYAFISRFIDSICNNAEPPATGEDGLETIKILETICKQM